MKKEEFYKTLVPKERNLDKIASESIEDPKIISYLLEGVKNKNVRIRFGCFNTLVIISGQAPGILYPYFDLFAEYLESDNKFIKLGGIVIIANLTTVDDKKKFDRIFDKFYSFINDPEITTASNVCKGSVIIAKAKPYLAGDIASQLLQVDGKEYKTEKCKQILTGHVISTFDKIFKQLKDKQPVTDFVKKQVDNNREATKNKAEKFLKKHQKATT